MASIFDDAQSELNRLDKLQSIEIRTCYLCDCGCDTDNMQYTKLPELKCRVWVCNECLTNKEI